MIATNAALLVPADYMAQSSPAARVTAEARESTILARWLARLCGWVERETQRRIAVTFTVVQSSRTLEQLQTDPATGQVTQRDAQGQGFHETQVWSELGRVYDLTVPHRTLCCVLGGGGWAGGRYDPQTDRGGAFIGDWGLTFALTGKPNAGCLAHYPADASGHSGTCEPVAPEAAWGHELLHGFGVDSHQPVYVSGGDALDASQVTAFIATNGRFSEPAVTLGGQKGT